MSNRIVPQVYRAIIDEVMANIKSEFEEFGVDDDVLAQLQNKWETKVVASNVAQFEPPAPTSPPSRHPPIHPTHPHPPPPPPQHHPHMHPHHPPHPSHPSLIQYPYQPYPPPPGYPYAYPPHPQGYQLPPLVQPPPPQPVPPQQAPAPSPTPRVKTEDDDNPKHGTFAGGGVPLARVPQLDGAESGETPSGVDGWDGAVGASTKRKYSPLEEYMRLLPPPPQAGPSRLPQLDGSSDLDPASPPLQTLDDGRGTEEIGSDLDDSDDSDADDVENEGAGEAGDYVFCTYDKVQRVKNKWKCVLKDGMIHVNGKDYLFMKCNGYVFSTGFTFGDALVAQGVRVVMRNLHWSWTEPLRSMYRGKYKIPDYRGEGKVGPKEMYFRNSDDAHVLVHSFIASELHNFSSPGDTGTIGYLRLDEHGANTPLGWMNQPTFVVSFGE